MDLLNALTVAQPTGFWHTIVLGLESAIGDYALALILITVIIKLIMVPFDFWNKYTTKKTSRRQAELQPEIDKINKKYAGDKAMINQKTGELYKSKNVNIMGSCFGMLIYFVLTMVIFWTLFGALNTISSYKIGDQFLQVRKEYFATYDINVDELEEGKTAKVALDEKLLTISSEEEKASLQALANENAFKKYEETRNGFLWITNIWRPDTTTSSVMDYKTFMGQTSLNSEELTEDEYNLVISYISENAKGYNGYFILAVLAAVLSYMSTVMNNWVSKARAKKKGLDLSLPNQTNKILTFVLPIIMGVFTLFYNAAFGLYIVAGSIITLITGPLITLFVDMLEFEAIRKERERTMPTYDRKRK